MSNIQESEHRRGLRKKVEFSLVFSIKGHTGGNVLIARQKLKRGLIRKYRYKNL